MFFSILMLFGNSALAVTAEKTMQVNTSIAATCQLTTEPITFISPISETSGLVSTNTSSSPIRLTCTKGTTYTIGLSTGSSGGSLNRSMKGMKIGNTDRLRYNIYKDQQNGIVMASDTGTGLVTGTGTGSEVLISAYTSIPGGQFVTPDTYSDTLTVVVTY